MKWRILITAPPILPSIEDYRNLFEKNSAELVTPPFEVKECLYEKELNELLVDIDGIICGDDKLTKDVLTQANKLKVISKWGTGIDSIDAEEAKNLGIKVYRVKGAFANPVADTVMAYILMFARRIKEKDMTVRNGPWEKIPSITLKEATLGVIGVGHIGKALVRRAISFGMNVLGNDIIQIPQDFINETGIEMVSLSDLLVCSDFVSLHCDLNKTSYKLIGDKELKLMKSDGFLINTSRGEVVDEKALEQVLINKQITGAALDVFEVEPLPESSSLRELDNVYLSPHNANSSFMVFKEVHAASIQNLFRGLDS